MKRAGALIAMAVLLAAWASAQSRPDAVSTREDSARTDALYERYCVGCHGATGEGDGPLVAVLPVRPRDFVHQPFKWRSTPSGEAPVIDDVVRTITRGVPGTLMPAFGATLPLGDRQRLAARVLSFHPRAPGVPLAPAALTGTDPIVAEARGERVYQRLQCATCHGATLRGDGPNAHLQTPPPYDLTRFPARGGSDAPSLLRALRTGLDGTSMPAFEPAVPLADLADLACYLAAHIPADRPAHEIDPAVTFGPVPPLAPRDAVTLAREQHHWDLPLAPQGPGPSWLTPVERSLHPEACGRCHAEQFAQFRASVHAAAMGPGVMGQLMDMPADEARACETCHAPLAEQSAANATVFDPSLQTEGIVCAACHLRGRERMGPPLRADGALGTIPGYPLTVSNRFERGDFCVTCHQHGPDLRPGAHPVLDTVNEWIEGPYFARGVQCQQCHMPDRAHTWRGAHDVDTVRQAVEVEVRFERARDGAIEARVAIANVGTGHSFPGTTTPAAVLAVQPLDARDTVLPGGVTDTMQRRIEWDGHAWQDRGDTRIPAGGVRTVTVRGRAETLRAVRWTLTFRPDDGYEAFYRRERDRPGRSAAGRALLQLALDRATHSPFVVRTDVVRVPNALLP